MQVVAMETYYVTKYVSANTSTNKNFNEQNLMHCVHLRNQMDNELLKVLQELSDKRFYLNWSKVRTCM